MNGLDLLTGDIGCEHDIYEVVALTSGGHNANKVT